MPPSPRAGRGERHLSLSQAQIQELIDNPPTAGNADPKFAGRDWHSVSVGELCSEDDLKWVELDTGVEDATNVGHTVAHIASLALVLTLACSTAPCGFGRTGTFSESKQD